MHLVAHILPRGAQLSLFLDVKQHKRRHTAQTKSLFDIVGLNPTSD